MKTILLLAAVSCLLVFSSCNKDKIKYDVPATYSFDNVDLTAETQQMDMLDEMVEYAEGARVSGTVLSAQRLKDMFHNANNPFSFLGTQDLSALAYQGSLLEGYMDSLANASNSTVAGSHGIAGLAVSGNEIFLLDKNGFDFTELIEKGIMGAVFYGQAANYFSPIGLNSVSPTHEGQWDRGFGYLGLPIDYPAHMENARFWGKGLNEINPLLHVVDSLNAAAILGRAAIVNEDEKRIASQVDLIHALWDKGIAAMAIHELNEAKSHLADDALRNHEISECIGFIQALKWNLERKISDSEIQSLVASFGTDLYTVTLPIIESARTTLATIYKLENIKDQL